MSSEVRQKGVPNPPMESLAPEPTEQDATIIAKGTSVTFVLVKRQRFPASPSKRLSLTNGSLECKWEGETHRGAKR